MQYSWTVVIVSMSTILAFRRAVKTPFALCFAEAKLESLGGELSISGEAQFSLGLMSIGVVFPCMNTGLSVADTGEIAVSSLSSCFVGELLRDV